MGGKIGLRNWGVYIWTLKCNYSQYVGGSLNIYKRLSTYFETSLSRINNARKNRFIILVIQKLMGNILPEEKATINNGNGTIFYIEITTNDEYIKSSSSFNR